MSTFPESVVIAAAGRMGGGGGGLSKPGRAHEKDADEVPLTSNQRCKARRDGPSDTKEAKGDREKALADLPKLDYNITTRTFLICTSPVSQQYWGLLLLRASNYRIGG